MFYCFFGYSAFCQRTAVEMSLAIHVSRSLKKIPKCTSRSLKIDDKVHFQGLPFCSLIGVTQVLGRFLQTVFVAMSSRRLLEGVAAAA